MQIRRIAPKIYHLIFDNTVVMSQSLMRYQEYYESPNPKFRLNTFTREEFAKWYEQEYGAFTYYSDWAGFNVPGWVFKPFLDGKFFPTTNQEGEVLSKVICFKQRYQGIGLDFYLISTARDSGRLVFRHELAHALYGTNWKYRWLARAILMLNGTYLLNMFHWLKEEKYPWQVYLDESQAYIMANSDELDEDEVPYSPLCKNLLRRLYAWTIRSGK